MPGVDRTEGGVYISRGRWALAIPRSSPHSTTSCLQPRQPTAMAFDGTWKVDHNDNYDKFMEQMGECVRAREEPTGTPAEQVSEGSSGDVRGPWCSWGDQVKGSCSRAVE